MNARREAKYKQTYFSVNKTNFGYFYKKFFAVYVGVVGAGSILFITSEGSTFYKYLTGDNFINRYFESEKFKKKSAELFNIIPNKKTLKVEDDLKECHQMFIMDVSSDSDDSAFLFSNNLAKRKSGYNVGNKVKKLRLNCQDGITSMDDPQTGEQIKPSCLNDSIHADSSDINNKILKLESESLSSNEKTVKENDVVGEKFESQNVDNYFSCPLCLKVLQSEITHFSHMKQCAKKSKMSAKQLLEALQLHKQHLKERISAGLSNIPAKKKKIQVHEANEDSAYQLAIGLALSKSLQDTSVGKENGDLTENMIMHNRSRKTLENFGFTSFGKPPTATVKKSKNCKMVHSVLRKRSNEDREKLLTEKAGVILLINDDTIIAEVKESLRIYHCKLIEEIRNKDSHLWKLGENNEETEWYVEDLKNIILGENKKLVDIPSETVINEEVNIDEEILRLNLPKTTIFEGWRRLINNKHLSDLTLLTKDNKTIYLHSVVLYARHLKILDSHLTSTFHKFHSGTVLKFLQYLYCGTLDGLVRGEVESLLSLAQSLEYQELVEVLNCLKQSLSDCLLKKGNEDGSDCSRSEDSRWRKNRSSDDLCECECTNSSNLDERHSRSVLSYGKDQIISNYDECIENLFFERKEQSTLEEEISNMVEFHEGSRTKPENSECLPIPEVIQNGETHENLSPGKCKKRNTEEDQLEMDMFEEAENLNKSVNENIETYSNPIPENEPECIEISSGSVNSDGTHTECRESVGDNDKILSEMDYEIPYFDPYEHFNSDIPVVEPFADSEEPIHSQSLIVGEISPVKSGTPKRVNTGVSYSSPPNVTPPGCCSTPNIEQPQPSTSAQLHFISSEHTERPTKKKKFATPCSKINSKSKRLSKLFRSKPLKQYRKRKSKIDSDEEESEKVACVLTESILREFDKSIESAARKTPQREEQQDYIEVTPAVPGEEFVEDVSPLPDFSVMGASSIKKHLTKYGLKKSLSKNKAKKILRHIYEELHPILNTKNGKIVKYVQSDKPKKSRGKKETARGRKGKRKSTTKGTSIPRGKRKSGVDLEWSQPETPSKKSSCSSHSPRLISPKTNTEEDRESCTNTDSWDGASACSTLSDTICFEVEEPLSQGNYTSATDAPTAVYDFIQNNPEIRRQILMYEPIWLEDLQRKLFEKYNRKFKLIDLMDCLDAECVTFRCESQRRTNSRRK